MKFSAPLDAANDVIELATFPHQVTFTKLSGALVLRENFKVCHASTKFKFFRINLLTV